MDPERETVTRSSLTRREALKRAGKLGVALAWAVPVVQTIDIRAALAGSPPPGDPPGGTNTGGANTSGTGGTPVGGGGVTTTTTTTPVALTISQLSAGPSPAHTSTQHAVRIRFYVSAPAAVTVGITHRGRTVRTFAVQLAAAGWVRFKWNLKNSRGHLVPLGRYGVAITAKDSGGHTATDTSAVIKLKR